MEKKSGSVLKTLTVIWIALCLIYGCQNKPTGNTVQKQQPDTDTLTYTTEVFADSLMSDTDNEKEVDVRFSYVVLKGSGADTLNRWIENKIRVGIFNDSSCKSPQDFVTKFRKEYSERGDGPGGWFMYRTITVVSQKPGYITLCYDEYNFEAFLHPFEYWRFYHFDIAGQKELDLDDFIEPQNQKKLEPAIKKAMRKDFELTTADDVDSLFYITDSFFIPRDFIFSDSGINFFYNPYVIKPMEPYEVFVPYSEIKGITKPNTYLSKFVK